LVFFLQIWTIYALGLEKEPEPRKNKYVKDFNNGGILNLEFKKSQKNYSKKLNIPRLNTFFAIILLQTLPYNLMNNPSKFQNVSMSRT